MPRAQKPYLVLCLLTAVMGSGAAQAPQPPSAGNAPEMTTHDVPATFRSKVNLVLVPVVVRDQTGRAVGTLGKEDFALFDKHKPQVIATFSIETGGKAPQPETVPAAPGKAPGEAAPGKAPGEEPQPPAAPDRFVAFLFDDVHLSFGDLAPVRDAGERFLNDSLTPADRAGIFTTSGRTTLDFTGDRAKVHETLLNLRPQPIARSSGQDCPDVSYYQADLIVNQNDQEALAAATEDTLACMNLDPRQRQLAQQIAHSAAQRVLVAGDTESRISVGVIKQIVRRLSTLPGQRNLILVSPGFLTLPDLHPDQTDALDLAIRSNVIISSLDARGLYTIVPGGDASQASQSALGRELKNRYQIAAARAEEDVLAELADGTGGAFFHNRNDLAEGLKRLAARPEFVYVLGFSPQNLKLDGSYHALQVTLKDPHKLNLQARRGYYAPRRLADPRETAREEIQEALFSREELRDIPIALHTQFFKSGESSAHLTVVAQVDVRGLRFRPENGRSCDDLEVVTALFDRNGKLVTGGHRTIEMRLRSQTIENRLGSGITVRTNLEVQPGSYTIRLVVRDTEGQMMAAANGAAEIP